MLLSAPSLPKIFTSRTHFPRVLWRFRSTDGQSLLEDDNVHPRYRNKETAVIGVPYADKNLLVLSYVSSTTNLCHFLYVPLRHITEVRCARLRVSYRENMSHWGHRGWG